MVNGSWRAICGLEFRLSLKIVGNWLYTVYICQVKVSEAQTIDRAQII